MKIREIHPADNAALAQVIRSVLIELGVPKEGTAYADKELDVMYEAYRSDRAMYFGDNLLRLSKLSASKSARLSR